MGTRKVSNSACWLNAGNDPESVAESMNSSYEWDRIIHDLFCCSVLIKVSYKNILESTSGNVDSICWYSCKIISPGCENVEKNNWGCVWKYSFCQNYNGFYPAPKNPVWLSVPQKTLEKVSYSLKQNLLPSRKKKEHPTVYEQWTSSHKIWCITKQHTE